MVSFKAFFALAFVGLCFTTLQIVLSFHGLRSRQEGVALYCAVFGFSITKLVVSYLVRFRSLLAWSTPRCRRNQKFTMQTKSRETSSASFFVLHLLLLLLLLLLGLTLMEMR